MASVSVSRIRGRALPLRGDEIDTDRIIPARYLRCVTFDGLGPHAFEDDRAQDPDHPFDKDCYQGASLLFVGNNFGCGSSREHAPQSLQKWGIRALVGVSFAEIFFGNCTAMGIPCLKVSAEQIEELWSQAEGHPETEFELDLAAETLTWDGGDVSGSIPEGTRNSLLEGSWNATMVLLEAGAAIEAAAAKLPYTSAFESGE